MPAISNHSKAHMQVFKGWIQFWSCRNKTDRRILMDLTLKPIGVHAGLRGTTVGSHLQPDHILSRLQLIVRKLSLLFIWLLRAKYRASITGLWLGLIVAIKRISHCYKVANCWLLGNLLFFQVHGCHWQPEVEKRKWLAHSKPQTPHPIFEGLFNHICLPNQSIPVGCSGLRTDPRSGIRHSSPAQNYSRPPGTAQCSPSEGIESERWAHRRI